MKSPIAIALLSLVTLLGVMWVANQMGLEAIVPGKFAVTLYLVLESMPVLVALWLGAAGLGYPLRRWFFPETEHGLVVQIAAGLAVVLLAGYLLAWAGWMNAVTAWGLCAIGIVLLVIQQARGGRRPDGPRSWFLLLVMPGIGLMLVAATCPPGTLWQVEARGYDVLSYHLQIPREWMAAGGMVELEHNVYGYLPGLIESAFYQIGVMRGSILDAVYTCQLFSATLAILAAGGIACAAARFAGRSAAVLAAAVLVSVPWVLITGSMAYNETAVLAFGACAVALLLGNVNARSAVVIGLLLGAATLSKLTAGPMIALPVGVLLLAKNWKAFGSAVVIGMLVLSPYLIRNAMWTGNPVFPFAKSVFGQGHWDDALAARWDRGHGLDLSHDGRGEAFTRQWLLNTGYGAFAGRSTPPEQDNVARFPLEYGVPVLWLAVGIATVLALLRRMTRRPAIAMLVMLVIQLAFWLAATHLQSRFLIPTLIPACVLIGIGFGRVEALLAQRSAWVMPTGGTALVVVLVVVSLTTLWSQTPPVPSSTVGSRYAVHEIVDAMNIFDQHPINALPEDSKTYIVADNSSLLYLRRPIGYHSAFDANPLGEMIRHHEDVTAALRDAGYTHVYIGWSELARLHRTYGFDPDVTRDKLIELIQSGWTPVPTGSQTPALFALPPRPTRFSGPETAPNPQAP